MDKNEANKIKPEFDKTERQTQTASKQQAKKEERLAAAALLELEETQSVILGDGQAAEDIRNEVREFEELIRQPIWYKAMDTTASARSINQLGAGTYLAPTEALARHWGAEVHRFKIDVPQLLSLGVIEVLDAHLRLKGFFDAQKNIFLPKTDKKIVARWSAGQLVVMEKSVVCDLSLEPAQSGESNLDVKEEIKLQIKNSVNKKLNAQEHYERTNNNSDLNKYDIDQEIAERFEARSIDKGDNLYQFDQLIEFLEGNANNGSTNTSTLLEDEYWRLRSTDERPSFVILGEVDSEMQISGVKYVIVNDLFYDVIDKMSTTFPQVQFIRADKINETLRIICNKKQR